MDSLSQLLNRCRTNGNRYTHVKYGIRDGAHVVDSKYLVETRDMAGFWRLFCLENHDIQLGEHVVDYCPIRVDIRLRFDTEQEEPHPDAFVLSVIRCYQQAAVSCFNADGNAHWLYACVLESDDRYASTEARLAIHFPFLRMTVNQHQLILRKEAIKNLRASKTVSLLPQQPVGDWEDIIQQPTDTLSLLRGSSLNLTRIYGIVEDEHIISEDGPDIEIPSIFSPSQHSHVSMGMLPSDMYGTDDWLPLFLSIDYHNGVAIPRLESPTEETQTSYSEYDIAVMFLNMISSTKFRDYNTWLDIGRALYTITQGSEAGLELWQSFSQRYGTDTEQCDIYYGLGVDNRITIKTLAWYAKEDNDNDYTSWHRSWCLSKMEAALEGTHTDIATALYRFYWLDYVCVDAKNDSWYRYVGHRWVEDDNAVSFRTLISSEFVRQFEALRTTISQDIQDSNDASYKKGKEELIKQVGKVIKSLKTQNFKSALVKEAKEFFYYEHFDKVIDANPALLGVNNGIIELTDRYAVFRAGKPEDFVTKTAPVNYTQPNQTLRRRLDTWFQQMFPDKELLTYAKRLFSSCLYGKNAEKIFPILTGEGNNSKSMLKKLFEATFGEYMANVPSSLITRKRTASSSATPELAQLAGARIAFMQEPDSDDIIKSGIVKELTGGDSFFARFLHKNGATISSSFTLFMMCNKVPMIPNTDQAIINRIRILPFLSTWCENAPTDRGQQYEQRKFPMDPFFEKCIPAMAPSFLHMLVSEYRDYKEEGLKQPDIITQHTDRYWEENDPYNLFINDQLVRAYVIGTEPVEIPNPENPDEPILDTSRSIIDYNVYLKLGDLYTAYKAWFRANNPGISPPAQGIVSSELKRKLGYKERRGIPGWRLVEADT